MQEEAQSRILVIDDEPDACEALRQVLARNGYDATPETSASRALERVAQQNYDLVLTDVSMAEMDGLELCRRILSARPELPVVLITGRGNMDTVIAALRAGARDFLKKPADASTLVACVRRALAAAPHEGKEAQSRQDARELSTPPATGIWGESPAIRRLHALVAGLRDSAASVLIQGETGTGKELVARAIHETSRFSRGPFVALNCAAVPAELLESELFGHARGAFTGAVSGRDGLLVQANGGTLLLDEIGELSLTLQPKLLRALQERAVRPIGALNESRFDCRILSATNRDLEAEVAQKRFREDLFYRLDVVRIPVPPLRERGDDVLLLARYFLARIGRTRRGAVRLGEAAATRLRAYSWPGNVRELENCIEHATALSRSDEITMADLPDRIRLFDMPDEMPQTRRNNVYTGDGAANVIRLSELERRYVLRAVEVLGGNKTRAAECLGIDRRTLHRRLHEYRELAASEASDSE
jgi:two-component system response regulator HydG